MQPWAMGTIPPLFGAAGQARPCLRRSGAGFGKELASQRLAELDSPMQGYIWWVMKSWTSLLRSPFGQLFFNLGYLPSADKSIITQPETTLIAIEKIFGPPGSGRSPLHHDLLWT